MINRAKGMVESITQEDITPRVSVLMRIRDGISGYPDGFLKRALDSVFLANSDCDAEVIAVNNGSHDNTQEFLHDYAADLPDHRLIVIELKDNVGEAEALNIGADNAIGEYFIQLTARSYFAPGALRALSYTLDNRPDIGFVFGRMTVDGTIKRQHIPPEWETHKRDYDQTFLANFFMFRRQAYHNTDCKFVEAIEVNGAPVGICDRDFYMQMVHTLGWQGLALPEVDVLTYHYTGNNQMSSVVQANRAAIDMWFYNRWARVL